ncbi:MAG: hypothetical protein J6L59_00915 [Clostridia bacterium]|nr:hypothetical protein [Clostridia bacterium]
MFKKIVCAAIMTALLVSQAVCVLADEPARSVATTTKYVDGQASVVTTVLNVEEGDEITYLAYTGGEVIDDNIAYIDQKTVGKDETSVKFEYVADFEKFNGSKVMVGGLNKSTNAAFAVDETGTINANAVVTIKTNETQKEYSIAPVTTAEGFTKIAAKVEGTTLSDGTANVTWFAAADGIWVANSALNGKMAVTLTWEGTAPEIAATPVLSKIGKAEAKLVVLATKAANAKEYGIKVSKAAFDTENIETIDAANAGVADVATKIVKYAALGADVEGKYVIVVADLLSKGEYNVAAYSGDVDTDVKTLVVE